MKTGYIAYLDHSRDLLPLALFKEKIIDKMQNLVPLTFLKENPNRKKSRLFRENYYLFLIFRNRSEFFKNRS
jgi:hypothetical protein